MKITSTANVIQDVSKIVIFDSQGRLILQQRDNNPKIVQPNKVSLFGGGVENGEDYLTAAIRELKEEIGIQISAPNLYPLPSRIIDNGNGMLLRVHYFLLAATLELHDLTVQEGSGIVLEPRQLAHHQLSPLLEMIAPRLEQEYLTVLHHLVGKKVVDQLLT